MLQNSGLRFYYVFVGVRLIHPVVGVDMRNAARHAARVHVVLHRLWIRHEHFSLLCCAGALHSTGLLGLMGGTVRNFFRDDYVGLHMLHM